MVLHFLILSIYYYNIGGIIMDVEQMEKMMGITFEELRNLSKECNNKPCVLEEKENSLKKYQRSRNDTIHIGENEYPIIIRI